MGSLGSAFVGGIVFNAANILLSAAIAICGLSVAFPVGIGLALVLGVLVNYFGAAKGEPTYIFIGVALITVAIILNGLAYKKALVGTKKVSGKGILISVVAGVIMAFFLSFCRRFHGHGEFRFSGTREVDALYRRICFCHRSIC